MELEYLWIYNFREIFVNEGFNFSDDYIYSYCFGSNKFGHFLVNC